MKEKKYIDRLYQEKFKDFEAVPREAVWRSLSAKLKEEERKRAVAIPLWRRMAGIAAVLSLLLLIGEWLLQPISPAVVTNDKQVEKERLRKIDVPVREALAESPPEVDPIATEPSEASVVQNKTLQPVSSTRKDAAKTSTISFAEIKKGDLKMPVSGIATVEKEEKAVPELRVKKSIYDELDQALGTQEKTEKKIALNRMEIKTQVAPIYYGNFGRGNFLDTRFNSNTNEGEITYSYGINVAYAISDKIKIRSGVNKVAMSYNTSDISVNSVANPFAISNIKYSSTETAVEATSNPGGKNIGRPASSANRASYTSFGNAMLNQRIGFIEVPVELEYNIIDRRLDIKVIGGASTLFLDENMVSVNTGNLTTVLGEAANLNQISFSTNIGLGFDYNLTNKFRINLEPMFKYQVNAYNDPAGNFQPYYLGVYSGFSFKF